MWQNAFGAFVIPWSQVTLDGCPRAGVDRMAVGCSWRWSGEFLRVDGPNGVLPLPRPIRDGNRDNRAQMDANGGMTDDGDDPLWGDWFVVTDGRAEWTVLLIHVPGRLEPLCMFEGLPPSRDTALWVVRLNAGARTAPNTPAQGVVCFTPGTMIRTADGAIPVEQIQEGQLIQTKDNGLQPVIWIGMRHVSGARMRAMPDLAPVRIGAGALGTDVPDSAVLVSPDHRIVLSGPRAQALFSCDEVLVAARDLRDDRSVMVEYGLPEVQYIHLALPQHDIVFANAVATESFHPSSAGLHSLDPLDRDRLLGLIPDLTDGEDRFGAYARRLLTPFEVAVLRGDAGLPT